MAGAMNYAYDDRKTSINMTSSTFFPTNTPPSQDSQPQLAVEFNFFVKQVELIIVVGRDSTARLLPFCRPSYRSASASAAVTDGESWEGMIDAVNDAIGDLLDADDGLVSLVGRSWAEVDRRFLTPEGAVKEGGVLRLGFDVWVEDSHVYVVAGGGGGGGGGGGSMVPAAESSFEMLEKYEVSGAEEEGCCICLEELGGGGGVAVRMPCLHVFHGGCIRKWLRESHYCPLCRYEMPS